VTEEVHASGTYDWAPTSGSPHYEYDEPPEEEGPSEPPSLDFYLDEPSDLLWLT